MSGRDNILNRIRQSCGAVDDAPAHSEPARSARVDARLAARQRGTIPQRGQLERAGRIDLLTQILDGQSASIARLESFTDIPAEIADYLRQHNLAPELRIGAAAELAGLDWQDANVQISHGRADADTETACSLAFSAVAETGTLILHSGASSPTSLNFLPDNHIIVLKEADVLVSYEDGWDGLRAAFADGMPRTVNYVSGPSRTGDIEQTILLGAHGPRRLHVILVK